MHRPLAALLVVSLLGACSAASSSPAGPGTRLLAAEVARDTEPTRDHVAAATAAETTVGLALYRHLAEQAGDADVALSPHSVVTALGMLLGGAGGSTRDEITGILGLDVPPEALHPALNSLDLALASRSAGGTDLALANQVWADRGQAVREEYAALLAREYGAPLASLDIAGDPEAAREAVNRWAADATRERVPELFPARSIDETTRLVLANALALDATWEFPFSAQDTTEQPFTLADGTQVPVPTMRYDEYLPSGFGDGWQAVELPYADGGLSLVVIVPDDLAAFEAGLDAARLDEVLGAINDGGIHLTLPRFAVRQHAGLVDPLTALGMPSAFGPGADFTGMTGTPDLWVQAFEHEAVVEVDEQGIEAAAASGAAMQGSHGPTVTVDRPFLFLVRDRPTGALLFLGRVTDPRP